MPIKLTFYYTPRTKFLGFLVTKKLMQGFSEDYIIDVDHEGNKYSKAKQVARCGNAVPPVFSEHLVRANLPEICVGKKKRQLKDMVAIKVHLQYNICCN